MNYKDLCSFIKNLVYNRLNPKDLILFRKQLKSLINRTALKLSSKLEKQLQTEVKNIMETLCGNEDRKECLEELVSEFTLHLLKRKEGFIHLLSEEKRCYAYIATSVRNFLIDKWRQKIHQLQPVEISTNQEEKEEFGEKIKEGEVLTESHWENYIKNTELLELKEVFEKEIPQKEIKYFCYLLVKEGKKLYPCLWREKSKDAIYKDVSRNRKKVIAFLEKLRDEYGVSLELMETFVKEVLSEKCEKLRSSICRKTED